MYQWLCLSFGSLFTPHPLLHYLTSSLLPRPLLQYSLDAIAGQKAIGALQGRRGTFFCCAWMGYGFHEDGFASGLSAATQISKVC